MTSLLISSRILLHPPKFSFFTSFGCSNESKSTTYELLVLILNGRFLRIVYGAHYSMLCAEGIAL